MPDWTKRLRRRRGERFIGAVWCLWGWAVGVLACLIRLNFRLRWPDRISERQIQDYSLYVRDDLGVAQGTFEPMLAGLKFFYVNTLGYEWPLLTKKSPPSTADLILDEHGNSKVVNHDYLTYQLWQSTLIREPVLQLVRRDRDCHSVASVTRTLIRRLSRTGSRVYIRR